MGKALNNKRNTKGPGGLSKAVGGLDTLPAVRGEMARLYRLAIKGKLATEEATRLVYILREIRAGIESEVLTDIQGRLAALTPALGGRRG
jgi:hypothetical protein